jgi:nicotinate-nucleotide--dimethylbenzimidazole phosphoribosyltransferase
MIVVDLGMATELEAEAQLLSMKVALGTRNMCLGLAMTREQAVKAIESGIEIVTAELSRDLDIVVTGDIGIGNATASSAICAVMTGKPVAQVTSRGTGIGNKQFEHDISRATHPDKTSQRSLVSSSVSNSKRLC